MGWVVSWKEYIKKAMKIPFVNETNVADLYGRMTSLWAWLPKSIAIRWILECEPFTVYIVVHYGT